MEKCLVTKLKGVVDNDSLVRIGEIVVHIDCLSEDQNIIAIGGLIENDITLEAPLGVKLAVRQDKLNEGTNILSIPYQTTVFGTVGSYDVKIRGKYNIRYFSSQTADDFNIENLKYSDNITGLSVKNIYGDISNIARWNKIETLHVLNGLIGDVSVVNNKSTLKTLNISNSNVDGILNVAALNNLESFTFTNTPKVSNINITDINSTVIINIQGGQIIGTIESFVKSQKEKGRNTCDNIGIYLPNCSFGNINNLESAALILSWDASNNIIVKNESNKTAYVMGSLDSVPGYSITKVD